MLIPAWTPSCQKLHFLFFFLIDFSLCDTQRCKQQEVILDYEGTTCSLACVPPGRDPQRRLTRWHKNFDEHYVGWERVWGKHIKPGSHFYGVGGSHCVVVVRGLFARALRRLQRYFTEWRRVQSTKERTWLHLWMCFIKTSVLSQSADAEDFNHFLFERSSEKIKQVARPAFFCSLGTNNFSILSCHNYMKPLDKMVQHSLCNINQLEL